MARLFPLFIFLSCANNFLTGVKECPLGVSHKNVLEACQASALPKPECRAILS